MLETAGLQWGVYWTANQLCNFILLLLTAVAFTTILKVAYILPHSSATVIFTTFVGFMLALCSYT